MLDFIIKLFALIGFISIVYILIQVIYAFKNSKKVIKNYGLKITEEPLEVTTEYIDKVLMALISQVKTNYDKIDKIELDNKVFFKCKKEELK